MKNTTSNNSLDTNLETVIKKPNILSLDTNNNILMTINWEDGESQTISIEDFLELTDLEKKEIEENYKPLGYTLVGDKDIVGDYSEYFKDFHSRYKYLFTGSKELTRQRDVIRDIPFAENRELIFVKLNLPITVSEEVNRETLSFRNFIQKILTNLSITK